MQNLTSGLNRTDPDMIEAVQKLKDAGLKVAVLTNNWKSENAGRLIFKEVEMFDHVVESCMVGMRNRVATKIFEDFGGVLTKAFIIGREPVSIVHYTRPGTRINHPLH